MTRARRGLLLITWIATVAILGWIVDRHLVIGTDLRLFMPSPQTPQERLILDEIGEGPASRMLLLAISGADPQAAADTSRALVGALRASGEFRLVANGESSLEAIPDSLLAYRYLLSTTLDHSALDAGFLRAQLEERVRDLSSPAAGLLEPWLPRDPTLELLKLADSWLPARQPQLLYDVWFGASGKEALLVAETRAAGFDPQGQRKAADALQRAFEESRTDGNLRLESSGPGAFSVLMQERTQGEAQWLGSASVVGMVILLLVAYRSVSVLALGLLPLVSAGVAGLAAVGMIFGTVHGITLGFGFTLIGVAQDYPIHLFSHQHRGLDARSSARALWPTLATGVASTCVAYLAFLFSGVRGLAQLSVFTVTGLAVAGLTTRFLLPSLVPESSRDAADSARLGRLWHAIAGLPRPLWLGVATAIACVVYLALSPRPLWENDLGALTPIPPALLARDSALRQELGAPDVRYLLVIEDMDAESVLRKATDLDPKLQALVARGVLGGYDQPARYLPSKAVQEQRRAALPDPDSLRASLNEALDTTPFKPGIFEPFLADVATARQLPALGPADLAGTPVESRVASLLLQRESHWTGLVTLTSVNDAAAVAQVAGQVARHHLARPQAGIRGPRLAPARTHPVVPGCFGDAAGHRGVRGAARRDARRRVLAPMALTTLIIVALLHATGVSLSLFHLIALVLAAGLGLDYALFFEHAADDPAEQRRTLHAVIVCSVSTLLVFALLALSTLPVLRAIGLTVAAGVVSNFVLALLLTRPSTRTEA